MPALQMLGIIGLIMIVLEAALELKLKKEKTWLIIRIFSIALLGIIINAVFTALIIQYFFENLDFFIALIYAILFR